MPLHLCRMYVIINDKLVKRENAVVSAFNRSFRYGDGFFETMKMIDEKICLSHYHFERMFLSMHQLMFQKPNYYSPHFFEEKILSLAKKNGHEKAARIRLMFFRGDGGLYDAENHFPNYVLETLPLLNTQTELNENGLVVDVYPHAKKICDNFSHIKHNNFLPYTMAALWAKENKLNDAIVLNSNNRIADATIANIFILRDGMVKTPALSEGCISGVMRRHIIECLKKENIPFEENMIEATDLLEAQEVFFTNVVYGIRWIKQAGNSFYTNDFVEQFFRKVFTKTTN